MDFTTGEELHLALKQIAVYSVVYALFLSLLRLLFVLDVIKVKFEKLVAVGAVDRTVLDHCRVEAGGTPAKGVRKNWTSVPRISAVII